MGIKQDALAFDLGISQQAISQLEQKEALDTGMLEKISKALKVPAEAIKNFDEEKAVNIVSNTFNNNSHDHSTFNALNTSPTFNPIDKVVELFESKIELYERMLKDKNEMIDSLKELLNKK